jgi:hypothetical protein
MSDSIKSYSTTETATLIRAELKSAFPGVKFSVKSKSYSGGSSINVSWTDGPTAKEVDRVAGQFAGASFDGMIDLKSYHDSTFRGETVRFGADYVFTNRKVSTELLQRAVRYINQKYGLSISLDVVKSSGSYAYVESTPETNARPSFANYSVADLINQTSWSMRQDGIIVLRLNDPKPEPEPTPVPDVVGDMRRADVERVVGELWQTGEQYHAGAIDEFSWKRRNRELWQFAESVGIATDVRDRLRSFDSEARHA